MRLVAVAVASVLAVAFVGGIGLGAYLERAIAKWSLPTTRPNRDHPAPDDWGA